MTRKRQLQAEIAFLLDRMAWNVAHIGVSSTALVREACGGEPVDLDRESPRDFSDLERCEIAYDSAPPHLQKRMEKRLEQFRSDLVRAEITRKSDDPDPFGM